MKKITIFLLLLISQYGFSQTFYYPIEKSEFDSLNRIKYSGRVFFMNGSYEDGIIKKVPDDQILYLEKDGETKLYTSLKVQGFYLVHNQDTAHFVFLPIDKRHMRALRILIDGKLSLLRFSHLDSSRYDFWSRPKYSIYWTYYVWKNETLMELGDSKRLKKLIKDDYLALEYFNKNRKELNDNENYTILSNIIHIYNMPPFQGY